MKDDIASLYSLKIIRSFNEVYLESGDLERYEKEYIPPEIIEITGVEIAQRIERLSKEECNLFLEKMDMQPEF
ncbi:hypothetical protein GCM10027040_36280 [Halomonas shantousis]